MSSPQRAHPAHLALAWVLALGAASLTCAQPPASPAGNVAARITTLKFIADTLNQQGPVSVVGHVHDDSTNKDWVVHQSGEASHVTIDPSTCRMSYHWKTLSEGQVTADGDLSLLIGDVLGVAVVPMEQIWKRNDVRDGVGTRRYKAEPPVLILRLTRAEHIDEFGFYDRVLANQVAHAVQQARQLCATR